MSSRDLFHAARRLKVSVSYFFRDIGASREDRPEERDTELVSQGLQLLRLFYEIADAEARDQLIQLARHASAEVRPDRQL